MKIEVEISQEEHDCMLSQLRKTQVTESKQAKNPDGSLMFEEDGTTPVMNIVPVFERDGETPVMRDDLTVQEWAQQALNGKIHSCMKRAHMEKFEG